MNILTGRKQFLSLAMAVAAIVLLGTAWIGDDGFITLRVIDNFVNGFGLRYNVIERVQVFTHPLWLMLLTPFYALTREAMITTMLVSVAVSMAALWLLAARLAKNIEYGCLLVFAVLISRSLSSFATSGLENPLSYLLLAWLVLQLYRDGEIVHPEKAWIPAGIAGLLFLNRLDLSVMIAPLLVYLLICARGTGRVKVAVTAILPASAWMVFSLIYYGSPLPNTAYAKLGTGFDTLTLVLRGLVYTKDFVLTDPLLAAIICITIFQALRSQNRITLWLGAGIVFYIAYVIVIGGDFMSGRFFAAPGFLAVCLVARASAPQWLAMHGGKVTVAALGLVAILLVTRMMEQPDFTIPGDGIADERRFYYTFNGLVPVVKSWLETGSEPVHPWGKRGLWLKAQSEQAGRPIIAIEGNAGMPAYYAGPSIYNIDSLGLTDAFLARLPSIPGARVGHYQRGIPSGYVNSVLRTEPTTDVKALQPLLNDVTLATRAPLFEKERWGAIWRLLSGHYSRMYKAIIYGTGK